MCVYVCFLVITFDLMHRQTHQQTANRYRRYNINCNSNATQQTNDYLTRWRLVSPDTDHYMRLDRTTASLNEEMNSQTTTR